MSLKDREDDKNVHNLLSLDDGQLRVASHSTVVVVRRVTEDQVTDGVRFPRMYERDITRNAGLDQELPAVDNAMLLRISWDLHARSEATLFVLDGDSTSFDERVRTGWCQEGRNTSGMSHDTLAKRALGDKLEADAAGKVF